MSAALLANITRGNIIESQHYGHIAVVDGDSNLVLSYGDAQFITYIRSAAKPFQAIPLYEDSVPEIFDLSEAEMAVVMSSHSGEEKHVRAVANILRKIGREPADLQCGVHTPLGTVVAEQLAASGRKPTVLHNNCSGKHAGMIAACINRGLSFDNYLEFSHPYQQRLWRTVARCAGLMEDAVPLGVDGCSAPNFALPIISMAHMYAGLVAAPDEISQRIFMTFMKNPDMIAGEGRFDTILMRATRGKVLAKTGAEGIECLAINAPQPLGIAIKIADGNSRALAAIVVALLEKLQVLTDDELNRLSHFRQEVLQNHRGHVCGMIEAAI
ncbi:asparaginase [bacterium]|nr:asparaginase [bacterium]